MQLYLSLLSSLLPVPPPLLFSSSSYHHVVPYFTALVIMSLHTSFPVVALGIYLSNLLNEATVPFPPAISILRLPWLFANGHPCCYKVFRFSLFFSHAPSRQSLIVSNSVDRRTCCLCFLCWTVQLYLFVPKRCWAFLSRSITLLFP